MAVSEALFMRRFALLLIGLIIAGLGGPLVSSARAQELLPNGIVTVTGPFSGEQHDVTDKYIGRWVRDLLEGKSPGLISEARRKLLEPLRRPGATNEFKGQYSAKVGTAIAAGATSQNMLVRLNTMVIAAALWGGYGLDIARVDVADPVTAVRYWAAKAIADALTQDERTESGERLPEARRDELAQAVINVVTEEKSGLVREQMYIALAAINTPKARGALMDAMNNRVADYLRNGLSDDLAAEAIGLSRLYSRLAFAHVELRRSNQPTAPIEAEVRRLMIVSARYLQVVRDAMEAQTLDPAVMALVQDLVASAEQNLKWGLSLFDRGAQPGPPLADPLKKGRNTEFMFNVGEWINRLTESRAGVTADQIKIK